MTDTLPPLPEPAFRLRWSGERGRYTVSKPNIDSQDCYTADQMRAMYAAGLAAGRIPPAGMVLHLMKLADEYAKHAAEACVERMYGTSASYTAECTKRENAARTALHHSLSAAQQDQQEGGNG